MTSYEETFTTLEESFKSLTSSHPLQPYLSYELKQIKSDLRRLQTQKRPKRAIEAIGTAWKWLAGSPDHHDYEVVENKINEQLENNNRQVVINRLINEKINQLSNATNAIIKFTQSSEGIIDQKANILKYKIQLIKEEITNILYAITWAKSNTVNSFIFSAKETNIVENIFKEENSLFFDIEELLEFAKVKLATNGHELIYIISLPTINKDTCRTLKVKALKKAHIINDLKYENLLECKKQLFAITEPCEAHNDKTICNSEKLLDLSNDTCVNALLNLKEPVCKRVNNQHIPDVEEILPGTLLLNDFSGLVSLDEKLLKLQGSFIIQYRNSTVTIGENIYKSKETSTVEPEPPLFQLTAEKSKIDEVLSLQMVKELNINNTRVLEKLRSEGIIDSSLNYGSAIILFVVTLGLIIRFMRRRKPTEGLPAPAKTTEEPSPSGSVLFYVATEDSRV